MGLTPTFSTPAVCSRIFHSCIFHPCNYARAAFSTPAFSVAPFEVVFSDVTITASVDVVGLISALLRCARGRWKCRTACEYGEPLMLDTMSRQKRRIADPSSTEKASAEQRCSSAAFLRQVWQRGVHTDAVPAWKKVNSFQNCLSRPLHSTRQFFLPLWNNFSLRASSLPHNCYDSGRSIGEFRTKLIIRVFYFRKIHTYANVFYFSERVSSSHEQNLRLLHESICRLWRSVSAPYFYQEVCKA